MIDEIYSKTWKRLDINFSNYGYDTTNGVYFIILDHQYSGSISPDDDNNILYSGFSPDGDIFSINEILSPKVKIYNIHQPEWTGWADYLSNFYIYWTTNDWNEWIAEDWNNQCILIHLEYDWTYINDIYYRPFISDIYNDILDYRQFLLWTSKQIEPGVDSRAEVFVDGTQLFSTPIEEGQFTYNIYLPNEIPYDGTDKTIILRIRPMDSDEGLIKTLTMTSTCYKYVIYYMNKLGGWNWLFVNGRDLKTDNMSRLSYKKNYIPQEYVDMNKINYINNITENWEFTTGWIDESQVNYIVDLLQSNKVYIQDLSANNNIQKPVLITNSSVEYKTYKNQGRRLYSYTINVEASQPKYIIDLFDIPNPTDF